jgi:16S rRNA (guanine(1405)-N(7))-methyltransferase
MQEELVKLLLDEISKKKELKAVTKEFILKRLQQFFLTNGDIRKKLEKQFEQKQDQITKDSTFKSVVKSLRTELGIVYGSFLTSKFFKKDKILESKPEEILLCHKSSRERISLYQEIYSKIFSWYQPKKILDIACGLNPLSYPIISSILKYNPYYCCCDLNQEDMNFIQYFFISQSIPGIAKAYDCTNLSFLSDKEFTGYDLVFLFKALDSFETISKNISKELIETLSCSHIVVSFPTQSLKAKISVKKEKRAWFYTFLKQKNYEYIEFEVENELFICIKK